MWYQLLFTTCKFCDFSLPELEITPDQNVLLVDLIMILNPLLWKESLSDPAFFFCGCVPTVVLPSWWSTWVTEGQPFAEFVPVIFQAVSPCFPAWAKAHQQASLSASTTIHHQAGVLAGGGLGGYGRGPVRGQCVCPSPLLFSSPQAAENIGPCHRQQPHSSLTLLTMELQIYSGEERPTPFYCTLAPSPLSLAPSSFFFFFFFFWCLTPSSLDSPPSLSHPFLSIGESFLLLCSASPRPSVWASLIAEKK